jgi:hypothetical protein
MSKKTEDLLHHAAKKIVYPPTPDIRLLEKREIPRQKIRLRLVVVLLIAILIGGSLYAIPPVRAAIIDILKVGGIEIRIGEENETPAPNVTLLSLAGRTTLKEARNTIHFPLYYPVENGLPDDVFVQADEMVIMVWLKDGQIEMALYQFPSDFSVYKGAEGAEVTSVKGRLAVWVDEPHVLWFTEDNLPRRRTAFLVEAPVLIWENSVTNERGITYHVTYRLESGLSMESAIQIAESLGTFPP